MSVQLPFSLDKSLKNSVIQTEQLEIVPFLFKLISCNLTYTNHRGTELSTEHNLGLTSIWG